MGNIIVACFLLTRSVQPVWQTRFDNRVERTATVRSAGCQTGLYNRYDNRLYTRYSRLSTGCQTGWMFAYTIQPVVKPAKGLATGCIVYTNIYPVVKRV